MRFGGGRSMRVIYKGWSLTEAVKGKAICEAVPNSGLAGWMSISIYLLPFAMFTCSWYTGAEYHGVVGTILYPGMVLGSARPKNKQWGGPQRSTPCQAQSSERRRRLRLDTRGGEGRLKKPGNPGEGRLCHAYSSHNTMEDCVGLLRLGKHTMQRQRSNKHEGRTCRVTAPATSHSETPLGNKTCDGTRM